MILIGNDVCGVVDLDIVKRFNRTRLAGYTSPLQSEDAFAKLYERAHVLVYRYIYGLRGGPVEDVEDLTAETFMRAWKTRERFEGDAGAAIGWLLKIARHLVIDGYRQRSTRVEDVALDDVSAAASNRGPEDQVISGEQMEKLMHALDVLPVDRRDMVVLRYVLGWRVKHIAEHVGMAENTVSVALRRALSVIRQTWSEE